MFDSLVLLKTQADLYQGAHFLRPAPPESSDKAGLLLQGFSTLELCT